MSTADKLVFFVAVLLVLTVACAGVKVDCSGHVKTCAMCTRIDSTWVQAWESARGAIKDLGK